MICQKKISIAIQGGGSHGAFSWGVLDKLLEDGRFFIESISGTSAGALNAVTYLQGFMDGGPQGARSLLKKMWQSISDLSIISPYSNSVFAMDHMLISPYVINPINFHPLKKIITNFFNFPALRKLEEINIFLCATNVLKGKLKIFTNKDLSMEVILASGCMPKLFHAVKVEGQFYWDGNICSNPAIFPLIKGSTGTDILIIQLFPMEYNTLPININDIKDRILKINSNLSLYKEMRAISFITELIDSGVIKENQLKRLYMHRIVNDDLLIDLSNKSYLNIQWKLIEEFFNQGRLSAHQWIKDNFDSIGVKSSIDIASEFVNES